MKTTILLLALLATVSCTKKDYSYRESIIREEDWIYVKGTVLDTMTIGGLRHVIMFSDTAQARVAVPIDQYIYERIAIGTRAGLTMLRKRLD